MKQKKCLSLLAVAAVLVFVLASGFFLYIDSQVNAEKLVPKELAYSPFEFIALFWVAHGQGFFKKNKTVDIIP